MKKLYFVGLCILLCFTLLSCQRDMTETVRDQLYFSDTRVLLTTDTFCGECNITVGDGTYELTNFSLPAFEKLTASVTETGVFYTLDGVALPSVREGVEDFLLLRRVICFLLMQTYLYRASDADEGGGMFFAFPFEGKSAEVAIENKNRLSRISCGEVSLEIIGKD